LNDRHKLFDVLILADLEMIRLNLSSYLFGKNSFGEGNPAGKKSHELDPCIQIPNGPYRSSEFEHSEPQEPQWDFHGCAMKKKLEHGLFEENVL